MTALEFIRQEFLEKLTNENYKKSFDQIIEQAKEMEKEQRREDLESGFHTGRLYQSREGDTTLEQLKSKTFKSE